MTKTTIAAEDRRRNQDGPKLLRRRRGKDFTLYIPPSGARPSSIHVGQTIFEALQNARAEVPDAFIGLCTICGGLKRDLHKKRRSCPRCFGTGSFTDDRAKVDG